MKTNICLLLSLLKERQERDFLSRLRDFEHQFAVHSVQIRKTVILQISKLDLLHRVHFIHLRSFGHNSSGFSDSGSHSQPGGRGFRH